LASAEAFGGYDETFSHNEDAELDARLTVAQSKKVSQQERKRLRSWRRLENEETALGSNKETDWKRTEAHQVSPKSDASPHPPGCPPLPNRPG
jgi:hypothetical protein